ncbi:hypothetical protein, partial [uncultured Dialister sp.]|uniref:hypothetical protein n=1 Tax=uncultured Dialister sp. TaxID=278064 RepID=UPI0025F89D07
MQTPNSLGIGDGKAPDFFGAKKGEEEIIDISSPSFLVLQKDNTKTRIQIRARQYCGPLRI